MMDKDLEFMSNLSEAILIRNSRTSKIILNMIIISFLWVVIWAYNAPIDQITRGRGKIVPSSNIQIVQNLEGGIVSEILVKEGEIVEKNQPLLKIDNKKFESNFEESKLKLDELKLKVARLRAEAGNGKFIVDKEIEKNSPELSKSEKKLFESHMNYLKNQIKLIQHKIEQKKSEIDDGKSTIKHLTRSKELLKKQLDMTKPLVERGIESKNTLLRLEREMENLEEKLESTQFSINKFNKEISEFKTKIEEARMSFKSRAEKDLNENISKISQIEERKSALNDQVKRTLVRSPVKGIVKTMKVSTIGGVVKPGMDIVEIVPIDDKLIAEIKIKPSDIAFLYPGQKAKIKFTAYNFSKYGAMDAKLISISADTILSRTRRGGSYYLVKLETEKNFLGEGKKPLKIIPGMTVSADILIGKRTVFEYIADPIFKVFDNSMREKN